MSTSATTALFDQIYPAADVVLDSVYAKTFIYRAYGIALSITASLRAHDIVADEMNDLIDSWHGHNFELHSADLIANGKTFRPEAGHEIAEPLFGGGYEVYVVVPITGQRCYDPLDAEEVKLLVYAKKRRVEEA